MNWNKYAPFFREIEFSCRHCGRNDMRPAFMDTLLSLRQIYGKPMIVTSGYRCPVHNAEVSTTGAEGPHTTGLAGDFQVSGADAHELVGLAVNFNFTGLGINQKGEHSKRFIHLDLIQVGESRPRIWSY